MCYHPPNPSFTLIFSISVEGESLALGTVTDISEMMKYPAPTMPSMVVTMKQGCWVCEMQRAKSWMRNWILDLGILNFLTIKTVFGVVLNSCWFLLPKMGDKEKRLWIKHKPQKWENSKPQMHLQFIFIELHRKMNEMLILENWLQINREYKCLTSPLRIEQVLKQHVVKNITRSFVYLTNIYQALARFMAPC